MTEITPIKPLWAGGEFVSGTAGVFSGNDAPDVNGISIDSRTIMSGEAYFAIKGDVHDGHDFVKPALEAGASVAVVDRDHAPRFAAGTPLVVVDDVLVALQSLGRAARLRTDAKVAAITGSVGKTGTKEALRLALTKSGETHFSVKSFNNHWGVPLTLSRMPEDVDFGVFEIGMNHAGEITPLTRMVRPHVAIITTIEPVHIEFFDSVAGIADAKAEIFLGLVPGGTAILNRDNAYCDQLIDRAQVAGVSRILTFGRSGEADIRLIDAEVMDAGTRVSVDFLGRMLTYTVGAPGVHWVMNSLAVLGAVDTLDADVEMGLEALRDIAAPEGRGQTVSLPTDAAPITLIDESYNANPASMRAALALLGQTQPSSGGRRIAILGDMLELGEDSPRYHAELADPVEAASVDLVFTCGPLFENLADKLPRSRRGAHAPASAELIPLVLASVEPGDVVMVKGSLGSRMSPVVEALKSRYPDPHE
ncbi:MAG: UDP-N-acetylmuramoylalanyl-D-glutamyl-2,6-diaminopimelate--D-alanyl-D-alanine ligase [Pseudomonadota bacterium]